MNGGSIAGVVVLIVFAAMLANLAIHPEGTAAIFNGLGGLWRTGLNASLGKTS